MNLAQVIHQRWAAAEPLNTLLPASRVFTGLGADAGTPLAVLSKRSDRPVACFHDGSGIDRVGLRIQIFHHCYEAAAAVMHQVKVAFDRNHFALYFSRSTIPFVRDRGKTADYWKHHGIYAYRMSFLSVFTRLPQGALEKLEALEQLRALEHGYRIKVVETRYDSIEVDTPHDLERVKTFLAGKAR